MIVSPVNLLGLNARNRLFLSTNKKEGRRIADSKLLTKRILKKNHSWDNTNWQENHSDDNRSKKI